MCTFRDPTLARSKGLLAGINYIPGLLHLPDYLQLLHSWPREGEAPTAPPPPLPEGKQGATANATWSGRHFIQIPAVLVAHGIVCHKPSGLLTESSLRRREKKRRKKKESKTAASRDQSTAIAQISKLWQDIPRKPFPIKHPGLGEGGWDKEQAGAQVTEPVQALPWLWTSVGKSSMNFSPRQASLLQTASCCITATL